MLEIEALIISDLPWFIVEQSAALTLALYAVYTYNIYIQIIVTLIYGIYMPSGAID